MYAECVRYYEKTGLYPINHGGVIKREIVEKHPWTVLNLFNAFQQAAELADKQRMAYVGYHLETGLLPAEADKALQQPLARHGIRFNRKVLDTWLQYTYEQGVDATANEAGRDLPGKHVGNVNESGLPKISKFRICERPKTEISKFEILKSNLSAAQIFKLFRRDSLHLHNMLLEGGVR